MHSEISIHHFWRECSEQITNTGKQDLQNIIKSVRNVRKQKIKILHFELKSKNNKQIKSYINASVKMNFLQRNL